MTVPRAQVMSVNVGAPRLVRWALLPPGVFGENLTLVGVKVAAAVVGERCTT